MRSDLEEKSEEEASNADLPAAAGGSSEKPVKSSSSDSDSDSNSRFFVFRRRRPNPRRAKPLVVPGTTTGLNIISLSSRAVDKSALTTCCG